MKSQMDKEVHASSASFKIRKQESIIIGNNKSEVKQILEAAKGGFYYTEYNEKIVFDLERLSERKEELSVMGSNAREFVIENFSKDKILSKFINKLRNL